MGGLDPFTYFTDHEGELGELVSAGRAREFAAMGWGQTVPDPQKRATFESSILRWEEREQGAHARMLAWYRALIALRRERSDLHDPDLRRTEVEVLAEETVLLHRGELTVLAHRGPGEMVDGPRAAEVLAAFGELEHGPDGRLALRGPGAVVLRSVTTA
ncbi:DUF3459 domain-containing protein [Brachybacterium sp. Z12]|uniref:DUF3459 domain-containing protein n=1 Tax=Brachybacterium sp. Z12 TaxID=2759167 RepID=UPI00292A51F3|nr:DUF3459 domain-containing protein [Brachybacterium sp. Z12]